MCGEHSALDVQGLATVGSSPHVRGARRRRTAPAPRPGIIPACAGSTVNYHYRQLKAGDHPRMCGEHKHSGKLLAPSLGSSPHVRGARRCWRPLGRTRRIIPACAGSTNSGLTMWAQDGDHPRMCGEHILTVPAAEAFEGSSPHVRGAQRHHRQERHVYGIIPACAGSTWFSSHSYAVLQGSSPHVRGAPHAIVS